MINVRSLIRSGSRLISKHSPEILGAAGLGLSVASVIYAIRDTPKAYEQIAIFEEEVERPLTPKEKFDVSWRVFIPTGVTLFSSVVMVVSALTIQNKRLQAMAAFAGAAAETIRHYDNTLAEELGEQAAEKIKAKTAERSAADLDFEDVLDAGGDTLFYDEQSGRYFTADFQSVRAAVNDLNHDLMSWNWVSLNDLYSRIGLPTIRMGDNMGWDSDELIELRFRPLLSTNGTQYIQLGHVVQPKPDDSYRSRNSW